MTTNALLGDDVSSDQVQPPLYNDALPLEMAQDIQVGLKRLDPAADGVHSHCDMESMKAQSRATCLATQNANMVAKGHHMTA